MDTAPAELREEMRHERLARVRVGATGLAVIVIIVLLAASFSGTASNEPELTPEAMAEQAASEGDQIVEGEALPEDPLAELGVAPAAAPPEGETEDAEAGDSGAE